MPVIQSLREPTWSDVRKACVCLFGTDPGQNGRLFSGLTPDRLRAAFRKKAKELHPDALSGVSSEHRQARADRFVAVKDAYEILSAHLQSISPHSSPFETGPGTIIAVGGAKGGIGKSLFAANLGILLASSGHRTLLVDLDLGSANLHLYLGEKALLRTSINDFLSKRVARLEEVMVPSPHGPWMIGGDSSQLGSANLPFSRKLKLIRALRSVPADVVILDLGGDTTFNILDFFLAADVGIVLTTQETASTLSAYHFLKGAVYRRLTRLFGPESPFAGDRDEVLERIIRSLIDDGAERGKTLGDLIRDVRAKHPSGTAVLQRALQTFRPFLLLNKVPPGRNVQGVVHKLQAVSARWLNIKLRYLGGLTNQRVIEQCALTLTPVVARYPGGTLAREIGDILSRMNPHPGRMNRPPRRTR